MDRKYLINLRPDDKADAHLAVTLAVNPSEIKINGGMDVKTFDVIGLGEIVKVSDKPKLRTFQISTFAWAQAPKVEGWFNFFPSASTREERENQYQESAYRVTNEVHKLETLKNRGKPIRFVMQDAGIDMLVIITEFEVSIKAGEEDDRYFTLKFKEYREHKAVRVDKLPAS